MKKLLATALLSLSVALTGCGFGETTTQPAPSEGSSNGNDEPKQEATIVLDMSLPEGPGTKNDAGAQAFKQKLEELTNGEMSINIHYSNAFGGEREVYEMMGQGTLDLALQSSGPMGVFDERMYIFDLPYIFQNTDHARAVLDSEIGNELADIFEEAANVKVLAWVENGFVVLASTGTTVKDVADLKNYKLRVQESAVQIDTWRAVGADPTPMAWPEVFTSLQQGVIDGHDQAIMVLDTGKFYEIQDSVTILNARFVAAPISISADKFNSFTAEQQQALIEAAEYGRDQGRKKVDEMYTNSKEFLATEGGMEIYEFTDEQKAEYLELTKGVYEKWSPVIGEEIITKVREFQY